MAKLTDSVFLILRPEVRGGKVISFTTTGIRKNKPSLNRGEVALQLNVTIDSSFFEDYIPVLEANVESIRDLIAPTAEIAEQVQ